MKRNEKNGIVCSVCLMPETFENSCVWFCQRYCQRSFHEQCKIKLFPDRSSDLTARKQPSIFWECDDCAENTAECFCCKKKGVILVFPKKGKPKAAGSGNFLNEISPFGAAEGSPIIDDNEE